MYFTPLLWNFVYKVPEEGCKAKDFLQKIQAAKKPRPKNNEYKIFVIEGIKRIEILVKRQHQSARKEVNVLTTSNRWLRIMQFCVGDYIEALKRGVNYRVFVQDTQEHLKDKKDVHMLMSYSNFELKVGKEPLTKLKQQSISFLHNP